MRHLAILVLVANLGCIGAWRRDEIEARVLREHYAVAPIATDRPTLERLWAGLDLAADLGCLSVTKPCRVRPFDPARLCLRWGAQDACFQATDTPEGLRLSRLDDTPAPALERWLYERVDPEFAATRNVAVHVADAEARAAETPPVDANSFWATTRAVVQVPNWSLGQHVQGGWRRWLEHSVLVSLGAGYERTYTAPGAFEPRDAVLLTARLELSSFDQLATKRLFLPALSAYVGLTGVLGVTPEASWATRAYVGFSAIVPFSIELGYSLVASPRGSVGQFYVGAGLGI